MNEKVNLQLIRLKRELSNSSAIVLISVVVISAISLLISITILSIALNHHKTIKNSEKKEQEYHLRQAGLKKGNWIIKNHEKIDVGHNPQFYVGVTEESDYLTDSPDGSPSRGPDEPYTYNWSFEEGRKIDKTIKITITGDPNATPPVEYEVVDVEVVD